MNCSIAAQDTQAAVPWKMRRSQAWVKGAITLKCRFNGAGTKDRATALRRYSYDLVYPVPRFAIDTNANVKHLGMWIIDMTEGSCFYASNALLAGYRDRC